MTDQSRPTPPPPRRPLGSAGLTLWVGLHAAGDVRGHDEELMRLCEQLDERTALRARVFKSGEWRDRVGLRQLDDRIATGLRDLGIRTILPSLGEQKADDWTVRLARTYEQGGVIHEWTDDELAEQDRVRKMREAELDEQRGGYGSSSKPVSMLKPPPPGAAPGAKGRQSRRTPQKGNPRAKA